ncbi:MAG: glycoside hydrolase family 15 protein [Deltaproteobacteria bacterium]|nr:glycoside hydrolase family 15 protein [Deltaproteobacteria bacterium]
MLLEDLGLVGNCRFAALVDRRGAVVWCCLPRFDSEPVFARLHDDRDGGELLVGPAGGEVGAQRYVGDTNVLETTFRTAEGAWRVIDFAPRFFLYGRRFRPTQLVRILEPLEGAPRVQVRCEPRLGWSKASPRAVHGSGHVTFEGFASALDLATDIPLTNLDGRGFLLTGRRHLVLSWGTVVDEDLAPLCQRFMAETVAYWLTWVKRCKIPPLYQREVIRSALALKLHCFDDTGAVVASPTTSIPASPGVRPRDLRHCRLKDAPSAIRALHSLGHFEEREDYIRFLLDVAGSSPTLDLGPWVQVDGSSCPDERVLDGWPGFGGDSSVLVGSPSKRQPSEVLGSLVLAVAPAFFDVRFEAKQSRAVLDLMERLARRAIGVEASGDAPIELRTLDNLMSWAAADRMASVAARHRRALAPELEAEAGRIRDRILSRAWSPALGSFTSTFGGEELDSSLLRMAALRFLPPDHPRLTGTIARIRQELACAGVRDVLRLVEALAATGDVAGARAAMDRACSALSPLGLASEAVLPSTSRMRGNFPHSASHAALINAAFAASPTWAEVA